MTDGPCGKVRLVWCGDDRKGSYYFLATFFFLSLPLFISLLFPLALDWVGLASASQIYPSCANPAFSGGTCLGEHAEGALYCIVGVGLYPREPSTVIQ